MFGKKRKNVTKKEHKVKIAVEGKDQYIEDIQKMRKETETYLDVIQMVNEALEKQIGIAHKLRKQEGNKYEERGEGIEKIFYLCDGEVEKCRMKGGCYKNGGICMYTSDIEHAKNFKKPQAKVGFYENVSTTENQTQDAEVAEAGRGERGGKIKQ